MNCKIHHRQFLELELFRRLTKTALVLILLIYSMFSLTALAEQSKITLQNAIVKTLENHPELGVYLYKTQSQQGRLTQAGMSAKPEIELSLEDALGNGEHSGLNNAQTTLSVSWILENNIIQERVEVANKELDLIDSERTIKKFDVATQTSQYFLQALYLQESMNIANTAIELAEKTVSEINKRVKLGVTPTADLYRAKAELSKRKMELVDLKHEHLSAIHLLSAQWGSATPDFDLVAGSLSTVTPLQPYDWLKERLKNNPQFIKFHALQRVKQAKVKLAQEQNSSPWQLSTGLRRYERTDDYGLVASISIPFGGSNNNQGNIASANAEIGMNQAELDAFTVQLQSQLFVEYQHYEHNLHVKELLVQEIIPLLEKALIETNKIYQTGKYSYLDWLNLQNELLNAQSNLLDVEYKTHLVVLAIERLTGSVIKH